MHFTIYPVAGIFAGYLKIAGMTGGYYASGSNRMKVITKLLAYARIDGHIQ